MEFTIEECEKYIKEFEAEKYKFYEICVEKEKRGIYDFSSEEEIDRLNNGIEFFQNKLKKLRTSGN